MIKAHTIIVLLFLLPSLTGCLKDTGNKTDGPRLEESGADAPPTNASKANESEFMVEGYDVRDMYAISIPPLFALLEAHDGAVSAVAGQWSNTKVGRFQLVYFASDGVHRMHGNVTPSQFDEDGYAEFVVYPPVEGPMMVTADCTCNLFLHDDDPEDVLRAGNYSRFVESEWTNTTVAYEVLYPEDVMGKDVFLDNATIPLEPDVIHWTVRLGGNLHGEVWLHGPGGDENIHLEYEGREAIAGHLSNGFRPLNPGEWRLSLEGEGWFKLQRKSWHLSPEAWSYYGIQPL